MHRIPRVKYRQINRLCIFASGPNLVLNIFLINQGMFSVGGEYRGDVWFDRIRGGLAPHKMAPSI
jgi:hypothetical protein